MTTPTTETQKNAQLGKPRKLNLRQERFAELVASGMPATQAYRQAGYTDAGRIAEAHASRLVENGGVAARIAQLRRPEQGELRKTKAEKLRRLEEIAWRKDAKPLEIIAAIREHNLMSGDNAPSKVEVESGPKTLESIRERAGQVSAALDRNARLRRHQEPAPPTRPAGLNRWNSHATD